MHRDETTHRGRRLRALGAALALSALLLLPASALAVEPPEELTQLGGASGSGAGQFSIPQNSAADPLTGQIYVADLDNRRVSEFTPWGEFVKAFGWNVAPGAVNERQEVRLRAAEGAFRLSFEGEATPDLPFDANAVEVQSALNALPAIGGVGGEVAVTEHPGNAATATPFIWTLVFKGSLAGTDVPQLEAEEGAAPLGGGSPATEVEVRTQADGFAAGHTGLEACTAESGCQAGVAGPRAGQISPSYLAVDEAGDVFVGGGSKVFSNKPLPLFLRIQQFDPAGRFLRMWGGDAIADGAAGTGVLTPGSAEVTSVTTTEKVFRVGQPIEGTGIEAGTTIAAVGEGTITLSAPATGAATEAPTPISSPEGPNNVPSNETQTITLGSNTTGGTFALAFETPNPSPGEARTGVNGEGILTKGSTTITEVTTSSGTFEVGEPIVAESGPNQYFPKGTTITAVGAGTLTVSQPATASPTSGGEPAPVDLTTATIPWNASAAELQTALTGLSNIEPGDIEVTGPSGGPWKVEFKGARYGGSDVEALEAKGAGLTLETGSGEAKLTVTSENAAEVCEAAAECQAGAEGAAQGQFDAIPRLALSPAGELLAGDSHEAGLTFDSRIQSFSTAGAFESEVKVPGERIGALALAPASGNLYVTYREGDSIQNKEDVHILDPSSGAEVGSRKVEHPTGLATAPAGNLFTIVGYSEAPLRRVENVVEFDAAGNRLLPNAAEEEACAAHEEESEIGQCDFFAGVTGRYAHTGIGAGPAGDLFVSVARSDREAEERYVTVYGPQPTEFEAPPPAAPSIEAQYAISADATSAEVGARINPHLWADTAYYLEYGAHPCSEGGCARKPLPPGATLTEKVTDRGVATAPVSLEGLTPATTYHYRFVAQSSGGGPVIGRGGTEAEAGEEASFTTASEPGEAQSCPNDALRTGASAQLPDCRAYEMVSPVDKEGADVLAIRAETLSQPLTQAAVSGGRLLYASRRSFGDSPAAPFTSQYIAARGAGGWSTHSIDPPENENDAESSSRPNPRFYAFSPELCEAWWENQAQPPLSPLAPPGYRDLYRRTDELCGGPAYEPLNTTTPPSSDFFQAGFEGASADNSVAFFIANDKLAPGGSEGETQLYAHAAGDPRLHLVCILPSGGPSTEFCTAGESLGGSLGVASGFTNGKVPGFFAGAVSEDGSRVYWSEQPEGGLDNGPIYLRENPLAPQSALAHGAATGIGRLTAGSATVTSLVAARGKAELLEGSAQITLDETSIGEFVAGQPISGSGIPSGATVLAVEGSTLTLSEAAEASASERTVTSKGPMPFEAGQSISAAGIPDGTTIEATAEGALTLSAEATVSKAGVPLTATSECSEAAKACTLPVSVKAEQESGVEGSKFRAGAADGSRAVFLNGKGLYEFILAGQVTHEIAGKVLGVMGASKDAKRVYFASEEALAPGAEAGRPNLYLHEAGGGYRFIAALAPQDTGNYLSPIGGYSSFDAFGHAARVSPDGRHAAFLSYGGPTGYDNTDLSSGEADAEIYLYDAAAKGGEGALVCASCNPSGVRPVGRMRRLSDAGNTSPVAAEIPGLESSYYATRVLSDDGRRLFFESYDALTLRDTNGAGDVYEWEAPGAGGCTASDPYYAPRNGGCVYLISSGKSPTDSNFLDASPSGSDVFFTTDESLLPQDPGLRDAYDARVGGGFPPPQSPPPACEGEGCQPPSTPLADKTPASASFHGAGNLTHARKVRCRKGQRRVRRKGKVRCIKRHRAKHHRKHRRHRHHRRHRNRGGGR